MPLTVTTLHVKKSSGNDRSHFQNTNINIKISAENGQSATATTAACGRDREELLGPRSDFSKPCQGAAEKSANATRCCCLARGFQRVGMSTMDALNRNISRQF